MKLTHRILLPGIALLLLSSVYAVEPSPSPLPANVFKSLREDKPQTVVAYGTSLTIKGEWANAVREYFEKNYPGQVTFINSAKAGMNSDWGVQNLGERVLSKNPDLVFIEFSANDAAIKNNLSLEKSEANLDTMVKALREQNPQVDIVLQTMNPAWDSPKMPDKKYGTERPELAAYYEVYRRYANSHGLPLVDNYPNWVKIQSEDPAGFQRAVSDGIHPHSGPSRSVTWPAVEALFEKARQSEGSVSR